MPPKVEQEPVHHLVEIKSVDELLKLKTYESGVFEAGGYEWSLCLHLKGDKDREGKEYMSLYLSIDKSNKLGDRGNYVVDYKFFVFDYSQGTYVTFKEKAELRAFYQEDTRCGLSQFLSFESFSNPKGKFREGNCCKFGAEVMVRKSERKKETLTFINPHRNNIYSCQIQQFSISNDGCQCSNDFTLGMKSNSIYFDSFPEQRWKLEVSSKLNGAQTSLAVYLRALDLNQRIKMYVKAKLRVLKKNDPNNNKEKTDPKKNNKEENSKEETVEGWLSAKTSNCGTSDFMPWKDLEKGFVNEKVLTFDVEILVISNVVRRNESV